MVSEVTRDRDTAELARVGKKQTLERRFGLASMTGFSCVIMLTWEGMLVGGPAGLIYGYLVAWFGTLSVFIAMSELASMLPTAGGQYHWVHVLAPERSRRFLSYVTGWATVVSWMAAATTVSFFTATLTQSVVALNNPSYSPTGWQGTLIMWAVLLLGVLITTSFGQILPTLEIVYLLLHILGFFGTMIPLVYHTSGGSAKAREVFTTFFNLGGWRTQTLSVFIGLQGNAAAFLGTDGAIHMSEEVERSSVNVPRSMIYSILINGVLGFAMLISILFSVDNIQDLAMTTSTYPFIGILASSFNSTSGGTVIVSLIIFMNFANVVGALSASGRMIWSFARDRGLPGWHWLIRVNTRTSIPFNAIMITAFAASLLGLINIGSTTVFNDVISLILEGFYTSYLIALSLLLYRRVRGDINDPNRSSRMLPGGADVLVNGNEQYTWGPWRVKGLLGVLNNCFAILYLLIVGFFAFWPATVHVTAVNMNYSCVVLGSVVILSTAWYFMQARRHYSGPLLEVQVVQTDLTSLPGQAQQGTIKSTRNS